MNTIDYTAGTGVLSSPDGFLVQVTGEQQVEVLMTSEGLKCDCFIARVSDDGKCQHIKAIENESPHGTGFSNIQSLSQADADYYLSKLSKLDQSIELNQVSASSQIQNINHWLEQENSKLERQKSYYLLALEAWMLSNELTSKRLVHGSVSLRKQQPEIEIIDEQVVLEDERFVRVVPEKLAINKAALRQYVITTGDEVPGICVHLRDAKFSYKTNASQMGA